jgi:MFS family permease
LTGVGLTEPDESEGAGFAGAGAGHCRVPLRKNRDFVLLQAGQVLSSIGSESAGIAYPLLVLAITHSPAKAGIVGFARLSPWVVFGFVAGVVVDRVHRKRLMIVSNVLHVACAASLVAALALDELTFAQIVIVAFVEGGLFVLFNVAEFGALRSVVPASQLPNAAAGEQVRFSTIALVAPPLGGALFGVARVLPFLVNTIAPAFSVLSLAAIRTRFQEERDPDDTPLRAQLAEGFTWLWRHRFLRTSALLFTWENLVFEAVVLTLVVVARRQGLTSAAIGGLVASLGACSLAGSFAAPRLQRLLSVRAIIVGASWLPLSLVAFVAVPNIYVLLAAALPMFAVVPTVSSVVIGYRVAVVPDRLTGRVNGAARSTALIGAALGPLVAGVMLGSISAQATVAVLVGLVFVLAVVATTSQTIRNAPSLTELEALPARGD